MHLKKSLSVLTASVLTALSGIHCAQATNYTVIDLGTLDGLRSVGADINNNSQVTGTSWTEAGDRAFLYDGNTMQNLGIPPYGVSSSGQGINDSGHVAGYGKIQEPTSYLSNYNAILYDGSTMINLGTVEGSIDSFAYDINNNDHVTGRVLYSNPDDPFIDIHRVFLHDGNSMQDLGTLGGLHSFGYAINNHGHITGWSDVSGDSLGMHPYDDSVTHAFIYDGTDMQSIGTLGGKDSYGRDINDNGWVTGYSELPPDDNIYHAFLYKGTSLQDLGTLGGEKSYGYGINNSGHVVGYSQLANGEYAAFLYDGYDMLDLCVLTNCTANGWDSLYVANAINDSGDITGYGYVDDNRHAFLILADGEPPPPPPNPEICDDGIDNDNDGLTDCQDTQDCSNDPNCSTPPPEPEICNDGIDNDGDGLTDCLDKLDCRQDPACKKGGGGGGGSGSGGTGGGKNR